MTLIERVTEYLMAWATARGRVLNITGTAGPDDLYLRRFYIIRSNYFNFFIHLFFRSDRDDLHDHPWDFCTYLVRGAYIEYKWTSHRDCPELFPDIGWNKLTMRTTSRNRFVFRRATDRHKVIVQSELKPSESAKAALTLCFTGPTRREWGFVKDGEWVNWKKYLGLPDDAAGRG